VPGLFVFQAMGVGIFRIVSVYPANYGTCSVRYAPPQT
jgi:hypothetical protein